MTNIKKPLITRIVGNRYALGFAARRACSLLIVIVLLFTEAGYSAIGPSALRPALQFSDMGQEAIQGRRDFNATKNKEYLIFHVRIVTHEYMNIINEMVGFFDISIKESAEWAKGYLFNDKVIAMEVINRTRALLERLKQTPDMGYEDSAKEIVVLFTSILKEFEELEFPDLILKDADLREELNAKRQMYELAKRIIRNFIKTNGSFDFVGTPSITNAADSLSWPVRYFHGKGSVESIRLSTAVSMPQGLSPIIIDPDLLTGVWMNLLRNALEAGATEIIINGENKDGMIIVVVKDNGPGIDPKDMEHIFEPFWTKGKSQGTGLGLYICQEVIKKAGGTIEVDSLTPEGHEQIKLVGFGYEQDLLKAISHNPYILSEVKGAYSQMVEAYNSMEELYEIILQEDITLENTARLYDGYGNNVLSVKSKIIKNLPAKEGYSELRGFVTDSFIKVTAPLAVLLLRINLRRTTEEKRALITQGWDMIRDIVIMHKKLMENFRRLAEGKRIEVGTTFIIRLPIAQGTQLELISGSGIKAPRSCL